jgi:hypothetical protein
VETRQVFCGGIEPGGIGGIGHLDAIVDKGHKSGEEAGGKEKSDGR